MFVSISLLSWPSKAVLGEVDKGGWEGSQLNGPDFIHPDEACESFGPTSPVRYFILMYSLLYLNSVYFRDIVRKIMLEDNPGGFDAYYPGKKHNGTTRKPLMSVGPWQEISGDGHEKPGHLALGMGRLDFPHTHSRTSGRMSSCSWRSFGMLLALPLLLRTSTLILFSVMAVRAFIFLQVLHGCMSLIRICMLTIAIQPTTDKGSETGCMFYNPMTSYGGASLLSSNLFYWYFLPT